MSKAGEHILQGAREVAAYARGEAREGYVVHVPKEVDVRAIRRKLGLTREDFANRFGFPKDTVKDWEQGRRRPEQAARAFLIVIDREPELVQKALSA